MLEEATDRAADSDREGRRPEGRGEKEGRGPEGREENDDGLKTEDVEAENVHIIKEPPKGIGRTLEADRAVLDTYRCDDLRGMLRQRRLTVRGVKADLVTRLADARATRQW